MNYKPVVIGNQSNGSTGKAKVETVPDKDYILPPLWTQDPLFSSSSKDSPGVGCKPTLEEEKRMIKIQGMKIMSPFDNVAGIKDNVVDKDIVYRLSQMDVKSSFMYGKIEEEVYVCQPPRFEDLEFPDRDYKVEKALYGLHQAPIAWYETLSTYLLDNGFHRGNPQIDLQDQGVIDSGCSRHMTRNMSYLADYEEIDRGYVAFREKPKGWKINGKAISDESKLWHRRLGHLNFKTMNNLVKGNLVRGLPSKLFENDQTCVACQKGKQHRASYKSKTENSIKIPLHLLHMDLFGPTFVKSLQKKMYCLVVSDDYSRFTWVFFLATKDETSGILKSFITGIKNLVDHKVKVIRCDNETEFKNREMSQFCEMKGHFGKFNGKADECFFVRYSLNSKAFRVFNSRTKIVEENLHIGFSESTPNIVGTQSNGFTGTIASDNACQNRKEIEPLKNYILIPLWSVDPPFSQEPESSRDDGSKPLSDDGKKVDEDPKKENECNDQEKEDNVSSTNNVNTVSSIVNTAGTNRVNAVGENISIELQFDPNMPFLEDVSTFDFSRDDEDDGAVTDMNNLDTTIQELCIAFEKLMHEKFQMSSIGELTFFLGLQVKQKKDEDGAKVDVHMYRSMIGSLMYLTSSRPDIMFAVCACARYQVNLKISHLHAVKRIFRYLKGQPKLGLWYTKDSPIDLVAFSDSDYAVASLDRKSKTGGCQFLGCRLISWQCKKQTVVANSTIEVEYVVASSCCGQVLWIHNQLLDYGGPTDSVSNKAVHKELGDRLVRAATSAFSLEAKQDSGNITKTQSKATPNEPSSQGTNSGGGPICQEAMRDTTAQTKFKSVSKYSNDSLLARGNTLQSDDDSLKLDELISLCTTLQNKVLDLEKTTTNQHNEIASLKRRVKKLKKRNRSRTHGLKRLYKERRINAIDADEDITLVSAANNEMFDVDVLGGEEDKGKGIMIEEPVKPKKKDQIRLDEEAAKKLQVKFDEEERLAREKVEK
nr:uncharacterized mitochondrial protein AtMg00810-like [Tanacetum cinerariifolium]